MRARIDLLKANHIGLTIEFCDGENGVDLVCMGFQLFNKMTWKRSVSKIEAIAIKNPVAAKI